MLIYIIHVYIKLFCIFNFQKFMFITTMPIQHKVKMNLNRTSIVQFCTTLNNLLAFFCIVLYISAVKRFLRMTVIVSYCYLYLSLFQ